jgi:diguanylate cyclase (GGDEF)-like protein
VLLLDPTTLHVLEANPAGLKYFDHAELELLAAPLGAWVREAHRRMLDEKLAEARASSRAVGPFDVELLAGEPAPILEMSVCPIRLADYGQVLQLVAKDVSEARRNQRALEELTLKLERMARTDEMTGLRNYRSFMTELAREHERAKRYASSYTIIFCDVDHFKKYNDRNGHPAGDGVLKGVARMLTQQSRKCDFPARYGGEEFVILCPEVGTQEAAALAERVRVAIAAEKFPHGEHQPMGHVSVSIGIASYPGSGATFEDVLKSADEALYSSKAAGRNRATLAR